MLRDVRPFALRIVDGQAALMCGADHPTAPPFCAVPARAAAKLDERLLRHTRRLGKATGTSRHAELRILFDLLAAPADTRTLGRSVRLLAADTMPTSRLAPSVRVLAHALRAAATGDPLDRLTALDLALRNARAEPTSTAALFNRALLLGEVGLVREAAAAWDAFLAVEQDDGWREEARLRRGQLAVAARSALTSDPDGAHQFALHHPQRAREIAFDSILAAWGRATSRNSAVAAARELSVLGAIGEALLASTGEPSVARIAQWLDRASADPLIRDRAAKGHALHGEALVQFRAGDVKASLPKFRQAAEHFDEVASPFRRWTELYIAVATIYEGAPERARASLLANAPPAADGPSALAAMYARALGLAESRLARYAPALRYHRHSQDLFTLGKEHHNVAASRNLAAELRLLLGDARGAWEELLGVLEDVSRRAPDVTLQNALHAAGTEAGRLALHAAAAAFHAEGVRVAALTGRAHDLPEALLRHARTLLGAGETDEALLALERADAALGSVQDEILRERIAAEAHETRALALLASDDSASIVHADTAILYYSGNDVAPRLIDALTLRARARLKTEDRHGAALDVRAALDVFESAIADVQDPVLRASLMEVAIPAADRLTALQLDEHATAAALVTHDRVRALASSQAQSAAPRTSASGNREEAILVYAVLPDRIALWTVTGGDTTAYRIDARDRVLQLVDDVETAILTGDPLAERHLAELYEHLVAPAQLPDAVERITFLPDGALQRVPFPALVDDSDRFLVQDVAIRTAATLQSAAASWGSAPASSARTLLVGVPAPAGLPPLNAVGAEIAALAQLYDASTRLEGRTATRSAFLAAVREHDLVHFAGHALASGARPLTARLVLTADTSGEGELLASDIVAMDLHHIELVVLAACASAEAGTNRTGAFASLAAAFIGAGAGTVVGSLWPVDDQATSELLRRFHSELRNGVGAAEALAGAQRSLLDEPDRLAAWASFRLQR